MSNKESLKQLQQKLGRLRKERERAQKNKRSFDKERDRIYADMDRARRKLDAIDLQIKNTEKEMGELTTVPQVSEHAKLRYLERVQGINLSKLVQYILPAEVIEQIQTLGEGEFPVKSPHGEFIICVQDRVVTTVLSKEMAEGRNNGRRHTSRRKG